MTSTRVAVRPANAEGARPPELEKISTGIATLDAILNGGIPKYAVTVIAGPPGTGKTILTQQMVFANATEDVTALYLVTVSEPTLKLFRYQQQFPYFDESKINRSVHYLDIGSALMSGGLTAVSDQIERLVDQYKPGILAIDSFKAIHEAAETPANLREFCYTLAVKLALWECTTLLVGEYGRQDLDTGPAFAIADGIIFLDREARAMQTLRYLEVIKMRGNAFFGGKHPMEITSDGFQVYPRIKMPDVIASYEVAQRRLSTGVAGVDQMMSGGMPEGTVTLVAGSAGMGKTLLGLHFLLEGIKRGEPGLLATYQETPSMLQAFASSFGWDLQRLEQEGSLKIVYTSPVEIDVDVHTHYMRDVVEQAKAKRLVIDTLTDIEMATPDKVRFKDYVYSLVNSFRAAGITSLLTNEISQLFGEFALSESGISFVADNVILLRYVELESKITRALSVLKMRGSNHDKDVREFEITEGGMNVLSTFSGQEGILTGRPSRSAGSFQEVLQKMTRGGKP